MRRRLAFALLPILALPAQAPLRQPGVPALQPFCTWTYVLRGARYGVEAYFVDTESLRGLPKEPKRVALDLLRQGQVAFGRRMTFLIDVSGGKRRELLETLLRQCWPETPFPAQRADVVAFLEWQGRTFNQGDEVEYIFAARGPLWIRLNSSVVKRFSARDLTQAMRTMLFMDIHENPGRLEAIESGLQAKLTGRLP